MLKFRLGMPLFLSPRPVSLTLVWSASGLAGDGSSPQGFGVMSDLRGRLQIIQGNHPSNFRDEDTEESKCVT